MGFDVYTQMMAPPGESRLGQLLVACEVLKGKTLMCLGVPGGS